jgi:hypothetical protein
VAVFTVKRRDFIPQRKDSHDAVIMAKGARIHFYGANDISFNFKYCVFSNTQP